VKRRLLNFLTALSLLLCVAAAALWVRSYFRWDYWAAGIAPRRIVLRSESGELLLTYFNETDLWGNGDIIAAWYISPNGSFTGAGNWRLRNLTAFSAQHDAEPGLWKVGFTAPHWSAVAVAALLPALRLFRVRRHRGAGVCRRCGYDLRATPGRCSECGLISQAAK
jgi:hypothetical protein